MTQVKDHQQRTILLSCATYSGHEGIVKLLLENGENVDRISWLGRYVDDEGYVYDKTLLWIAAKKGHHAVVKLLLEQGANVDGRSDPNKETALHTAAENGHMSVVQLLLDRRADVCAGDSN